jgi:hypothetical protein
MQTGLSWCRLAPVTVRGCGVGASL